MISSAHFFLPDPPNVTSLTPEFLQRLRGQFAVFSCTVTGRPPPPVQWSRNNSYGLIPISRSPFKHSIRESVQFSMDGPDSVSSTLTIGNLSNIDDGQYTCRGLNDYNTSNFINARESAMVYLAVFGRLIFFLTWDGHFHPSSLHVPFVFLSSSSTSDTC